MGKTQRDRPFQRFADPGFAWKRFGVDGYEAASASDTAPVPVTQRAPPYKYPENGLCDDPATTPLITWEEFNEHDCENRNLWIIIHGLVYDVFEFIPYHPGAEALCIGAHTDITDTFWSLHPGYVITNMLPRYCIGR